MAATKDKEEVKPKSPKTEKVESKVILKKTTQKELKAPRTNKKVNSKKSAFKKVGIVIPVYNTPLAYYREAVESALRQDYEDLEIVLVHDGGVSSHIEVSLGYARLDPRVTVIVKPLNEGAAIARNIGIDYLSNAYTLQESKDSNLEDVVSFDIKNKNPYEIDKIYKSKQSIGRAKTLKPLEIDYIYFLDSDDKIHRNLVSRCLECASGADFVWFYFEKNIDKNAQSIPHEHVVENIKFAKDYSLVTLQEYLKNGERTKNIALVFVWQVFIDFKFLQRTSLRFLNQIQREDNLFSLMLILKSQNFYALPEKLISYRIRLGGETHYAATSEIFLPGFLRPLFETFNGDIALTKHFYVALSWFIQKLYFVEFSQEYAKIPHIDFLFEMAMGRFRNEELRFIHLNANINTEFYFNICFSTFLHYITAIPNADPYWRPFDKITEFMRIESLEQRETVRLMKEILFFENDIILDKNRTIQALQQRIQQLESTNKELKKSLMGKKR